VTVSGELCVAVAGKSKPHCDTLLPLPVQSPVRLDDMFADDMSDDIDITHQCVAVSRHIVLIVFSLQH